MAVKHQVVLISALPHTVEDFMDEVMSLFLGCDSQFSIN
jgi:hypothetical protein